MDFDFELPRPGSRSSQSASSKDEVELLNESSTDFGVRWNSRSPSTVKPVHPHQMRNAMGAESAEMFAELGNSGYNLLSKWTTRLSQARAGAGDGPPVMKSEPIEERLSKALNEASRKVHEEGNYGEPSRGVGRIGYDRNNIVFSDYKPIQRIPLSDRAINIVTINNALAKNIIGIQFNHRVVIYELEHKKDEPDEFFTIAKIQQFSTDGPAFLFDNIGMVLSFSLNSISNLSRPMEKRLSYCFSFVDHSTIYLVDQSTNDQFTTTVLLSDPGVSNIEYVYEVFQLKGHSRDVSHLAFDAANGECLASLSDDCTCIVWNLEAKEVRCRFGLESLGVACLWHPSEPNKLLVVEQEGQIRMFNTFKQCVVITINTLVQPIFSADWCIKNSFAIGVGTHKAAYVFDLSKLNSPGRRIETHLGATNFFKFSTTDDQMFASASCCYPRGEIKTFQKPYISYVWSQKRECLQGISWIYGEAFLMAVSRQDLLIYESALL